MLAWLCDIIEELENCDRTYNVLRSVIVLLTVICKLNSLNQLEINHYQVLFKGLCMIPDTGDWLDLVLIKESFLKDVKQKSELVTNLIQMQRNSHWRKKSLIEVIFSFPMLHFAQGIWTPFEPITDHINFESSKRAAWDHFKSVTVKWYVIQLVHFKNVYCMVVSFDGFILNH